MDLLLYTLRTYRPPRWTAFCAGMATGCVLMVLARHLGSVL